MSSERRTIDDALIARATEQDAAKAVDTAGAASASPRMTTDGARSAAAVEHAELVLEVLLAALEPSSTALELTNVPLASHERRAVTAIWEAFADPHSASLAGMSAIARSKQLNRGLAILYPQIARAEGLARALGMRSFLVKRARLAERIAALRHQIKQAILVETAIKFRKKKPAAKPPADDAQNDDENDKGADAEAHIEEPEHDSAAATAADDAHAVGEDETREANLDDGRADSTRKRDGDPS